MKKILLALCGALIVCSTAMARNYDPDEPKHEIAVGYGTALNSTNLLEFLSDTWTGGKSNRQMSEDKYVGPITVEYFYRLNPLMAVGVIGVYSNYKGVNTTSEKVLLKHDSRYFTIMPTAKVNWLRHDNWGMYSKFGLGYTHGNFTVTDQATDMKNTATMGNVNFQASLIGIEAGVSAVRAFAELGFGEQGVALAGVRLRF